MKLRKRITSIVLAIVFIIKLTIVDSISVYAEENIATQNPLFIPISTLVTTVAVGSGIIAKNSSEAIQAGNQLVNNVVNNIKNSAIERRKADPTYTDDWKVINGQGEPEEPNDNNKNGKWVALAGGTIASGEIWANKEMVADIMRGVYDVKGYQEFNSTAGIVEKNDFVNQGSKSQIALQLAKISNSAVTQFDTFLHSDYWNNRGYTSNDCIFWVNTDLNYIYRQNPMYPPLYIGYIVNDDTLAKLNLKNNPFAVGTFSNNFGSSTNYYCDKSVIAFSTLNKDDVLYKPKYYRVKVNERDSNTNLSYSAENNLSARSEFQVNGWNNYSYTWLTGVSFAYSGYKWSIQSPFQFTNNVYNVNQTFDVNFPNWLQDSINLLNQNINAVRLGIQSLNDPWNNTQTEVQTGVSPSNVINQYINNYYNPENIPDDNPNTGGNDEPSTEPETEPEPVPESALDAGAQSLWDWALSKIVLPSDIWDKVPFSIPYDMYLLVRGLFPTSSGGSRRKLLSISKGSTLNPDGITISSNFDAYGQNTRVYQQNNRWTNNAPIINLDLHFTYHDAGGKTKVFDYVKTIDLGQYGYFAMIIYIGIYISWMAQILLFLRSMFQ